MTTKRLFNAIHIPEISFVNGILQHRKIKKLTFKRILHEELSDVISHFVYKEGDGNIHCYYDQTEKYLFVESNELYKEFIDLFNGKNRRYRNTEMDIYLDVNKPEEVVTCIEKVYQRHRNDSDSSELCHIYGQRMWHDPAYIVANRAALLKLREAIDIALEEGEMRTSLFPQDDEAYELYIKCVEDSFQWESIDLPYHEMYIPDESKKAAPGQLLEKYKWMLLK